ncbi:glycosyl transferase family 28 [Aliigemmobacter aestuarii]|uniref:Glycosyl transferase family 28 n=1 Tax=Aliigemmobacter aestuarii TaxID=1445661 RepID=A0A4S3MKL3_9RHOB|nr:glycosyltransferase [Gemmobacter aestuarii]THD82303.1 glycosyl transferase family 28 [Gemmobacter aestuarii]
MIFATVGTQLPFDRLLLALDTWAALHLEVPVIAQTGQSSKTYTHLQTCAHLDQRAFADTFAAARVVVAHAGMGTILTALDLGKPLILMPRRADLGEHRNDHQQDTAAEMAQLSNVTVVQSSAALCVALDRALAAPRAVGDVPVAAEPKALIEAVRSFIWTGLTPEVRP